MHDWTDGWHAHAQHSHTPRMHQDPRERAMLAQERAAPCTPPSTATRVACAADNRGAGLRPAAHAKTGAGRLATTTNIVCRIGSCAWRDALCIRSSCTMPATDHTVTYMLVLIAHATEPGT